MLLRSFIFSHPLAPCIRLPLFPGIRHGQWNSLSEECFFVSTRIRELVLSLAYNRFSNLERLPFSHLRVHMSSVGENSSEYAFLVQQKAQICTDVDALKKLIFPMMNGSFGESDRDASGGWSSPRPDTLVDLLSLISSIVDKEEQSLPSSQHLPFEAVACEVFNKIFQSPEEMCSFACLTSADFKGTAISSKSTTSATTRLYNAGELLDPEQGQLRILFSETSDVTALFPAAQFRRPDVLKLLRVMGLRRWLTKEELQTMIATVAASSVHTNESRKFIDPTKCTKKQQATWAILRYLNEHTIALSKAVVQANEFRAAGEQRIATSKPISLGRLLPPQLLGLKDLITGLEWLPILLQPPTSSELEFLPWLGASLLQDAEDGMGKAPFASVDNVRRKTLASLASASYYILDEEDSDGQKYADHEISTHRLLPLLAHFAFWGHI